MYYYAMNCRGEVGKVILLLRQVISIYKIIINM